MFRLPARSALLRRRGLHWRPAPLLGVHFENSPADCFRKRGILAENAPKLRFESSFPRRPKATLKSLVNDIGSPRTLFEKAAQKTFICDTKSIITQKRKLGQFLRKRAKHSAVVLVFTNVAYKIEIEHILKLRIGYRTGFDLC